MFDFSLRDEAQFVAGIIQQVPNATITFADIKDSAIATINIGADGNPYLDSTDKQQTTLSLYLVQRAIKGGTFDVAKGADLETVYFEGRLLDPLVYPLPIQAEGDIIAIVNGQRGRVMSVRAFSPPTAYALNYDSILGQRIGVFIQFFQGVSA
jgi:hypothetical protein